MIAMNIYCKLPFGQFHKGNSYIIKIAELLGRTPSSLAMKLCNLASLDPVHQNRGIKGLKSYSHLDQEIWQEFHQDWEKMILESEEALTQLLANEPDQNLSLEPDEITPILEINLLVTEKQRIVKVRQGQNFFRQAVLSAYNYQCCITGNPIPELLVASHILPWSTHQHQRLNPRNGLCLARTHDSAFDRGLISFDQDYRLLISSQLEHYLPNETLELNFVQYKNKKINLPAHKFHPNSEFLNFHREHIFQA